MNRWLCLPCLGVLLAGSGCGGINASHSVSPLDFLLPGLHLQNRPEAPLIPAETNSVLASVRG